MSTPRVTAPELLALQAELLAMEPIFHTAAFGSTLEDYEARLVRDYWHVGASGQVYAREAVIRSTLARGPVEGEEGWVASDPCCRALGQDTFALTYRLDQDGRITRRLTIWRRGGPRGWQIVHHQGTVVAE